MDTAVHIVTLASESIYYVRAYDVPRTFELALEDHQTIIFTVEEKFIGSNN